jgi:adenylate cyclase
MTEAQIAALAAWITEAGLAGRTETALVAGFCDRAAGSGLPLARVGVIIDTLHPIYEGRVFRWERDKPEGTLVEYGSSAEGEHAANWRRSTFFHLLQHGESVLRRRLSADSDAEFPVFPELRASGITDYLAIVNRFAADGAIGEMDCVYSSWTTDRSGGFGDGDIAALRRLMPFLGLAVKSASLARIA